MRTVGRSQYLRCKLWPCEVSDLNMKSVCLIVALLGAAGGAVIDTGLIEEQGLYKNTDGVTVLAQSNFDRLLYGRPHAWLVQFYNSFCGHCRAFSAKYKTLAAELVPWASLVKLAAVDCSVEENNAICRQFEVMAYPSLRFVHENYVKGNTNIGEQIDITNDAEKVKANLIKQMQVEQSKGRLKRMPSLGIAAYSSYSHALSDVPSDVIYTFLVFEDTASTVGSELILDTNDYDTIRVKRVLNISELTTIADVKSFPGLVAVRSTLEPTPLTPKNPNKHKLLHAINTFLKSKNYAFPVRDISFTMVIDNNNSNQQNLINADIVYYSDLEKTLKTSLHTEIGKYKSLEGEALQALIAYLDVLITSFPFRANGLAYVRSLRNAIASQREWSGKDVSDVVKRLEDTHAPVYTSNLEYTACKGSRPSYRGYTCGLWTLFHTLAANAARAPGLEGPNVLRAMHGYVKHFFGCTECAEHFQVMANRNHMFDVKDNDKAVLWLWIAHNEVNLRLAGDVTEDPQHPKVQFPIVERCPECRMVRGAWDLSAVYRYLQHMYAAESVQEAPAVRGAPSAAAAPPSPISGLDLGMLSLLYILSFVILILVAKLFLTKRFYRKRIYKHDGRGKV